MPFRCLLFTISTAVLLCSTSAIAQSADALAGLTLPDAIRIASANNHDLRLANFAVETAGAAKVTAAASPNPSLTVQSFNINPAVGIGAGGLSEKTIDSTVRIDQIIERGGKRALRIDNATELEAATRNDLREAYRQLRISVTQAYYDMLAADEKRAITQETAALYDHTVAAAQKRQKAGDIAASEVARLQVDALRAQNDVIQSEADFIKARRTLALLLGKISRAAQLTLADHFPSAPFEADAPIEITAQQRPDVLAAQSRLRAAMAARKLALALRTRDVSVGVQFEHFPSNLTNTQGSGNSYGVAVQIPIFARYQFDGEIHTAELAVDAAAENLAKVQDQSRNDLLASWETARAAYLRLQRYDTELLAAAKKSADAAEFAYLHGALGVIDVLDARRTYRATRLDALAARADYAKSLAAWQAAVSESKAQ